MKQNTLLSIIAQDSGRDTMFLNIAGSLGVILLLVFLLIKLARHFGYSIPRFGTQSVLKIRACCSLGHREKIMIIEIGDDWLVLGVTPGKITHLHTLSASVNEKYAPVNENEFEKKTSAFSVSSEKNSQSREKS